MPAGKRLGIFTKHPPTYAFNMQNRVHFSKKIDYVSFFDKFLVLIFEFKNPATKIYDYSEPWEKVYLKWNTINTNELLIVDALPLDEIPEGRLGGLVCF